MELTRKLRASMPAEVAANWPVEKLWIDGRLHVQCVHCGYCQDKDVFLRARGCEHVAKIPTHVLEEFVKGPRRETRVPTTTTGFLPWTQFLHVKAAM